MTMIDTVAAAPTWVQDAACAGPAGADPDAWFPIGNREEDSATAVKICRTCPVQIDCLTWAVGGGTRTGIHGGINLDPHVLSPKKYARLRRILAIAQELWS